jgi:DNA-binding NtrC family response regulator
VEKAILSMGEQNQGMILVVIDDDPANIKFVRFILANEGLEIHSANDAQSGLDLIRRVRPQIVLLDLVMPGVHGMEVLQKILEFDPGVDVILMTGFYSTESAVEAIQKGAADYFPKPFSPEKLRERIGQIKEDSKHRQRSLKLDNELLETFEFDGMVGRSPLMLDLISQIRRIAPHFRSVLVTGPTGVGKELVARALHRLSPGQKGNFVALNCSSITESLAESELFGHVKGAFTGATQDKVGVFEYADGGTAMLDEIGEMPLTLQAKLLRVLQNQELQRVGSPVIRKVNVRVVAATNRDLPDMVRQGKFREDLYFRLCMIELKVPSLAERREDLPMLQRHFLKMFSAQYQKQLTGLTRRAQTVLARYSWPGNIRELENVLGHACMMAEADVIDVRDLPERIQSQRPAENADSDEQLSMDQATRLHAQRVLAHVGGNKVRAAEILGISRTYLYELLKSPAADQGNPDSDAGLEDSKAAGPKSLKGA